MGGKGISGYKHTDETRALISKGTIGRKRLPESVAKSISKNHGDLCASSKITDSQAQDIIEKYSFGTYTCKSLGAEYNLSPQQINRIILGKRRKHLNAKS